MKPWNITIERRYQLTFAGVVALAMIVVLAIVWMVEEEVIPSFDAPLAVWMGEEPPAPKPAPQPVEVASAPKSGAAALSEFVSESPSQSQPEKPALPESEKIPVESKPKTPRTPPVEKARDDALMAKDEPAPPEKPEPLPSHQREAFPLLDYHFEQAEAWLKDEKTPPLLFASYVPDDILNLARKERGFIVAEGSLSGKDQRMLVLLQQESNPRLIKYDSRIGQSISASGLTLRPTGKLASLSEAVELCFAGRPAKLFFHPTAADGSAIVRKQFAAIAAAGIEDPDTVSVTDGDLLVNGQAVVYVVTSILLHNSKFIRIADPDGNQKPIERKSYY